MYINAAVVMCYHYYLMMVLRWIQAECVSQKLTQNNNNDIHFVWYQCPEGVNKILITLITHTHLVSI